jgi:glycosyltransferase involved in cell wall biosynthesis
MIKKIRASVKQKLRTNSIFRPAILCAHGLTVSAELCYEKTLDFFHKKPCRQGDYSDVTAVIKTFERPYKLRRLLKSIHRTFPGLKTIIVDDSKEPIKLKSKNIKVITLPFDSGVSAGRAAGLEKVETTYVVNLDDDFIFSRKTKLIRALNYLEKNKDVDLVAGEVAYLPYYIRYDYTAHKLMDYSAEPLHEKGTIIDGLTVFEKCANFFVARTEKLKLVGWDANLKRLDHADFFTRARGKLTTVFDPEIELLHDQTHFDQNYLAIRHDYSQDSFVLNKRYPNKSNSS